MSFSFGTMVYNIEEEKCNNERVVRKTELTFETRLSRSKPLAIVYQTFLYP